MTEGSIQGHTITIGSPGAAARARQALSCQAEAVPSHCTQTTATVIALALDTSGVINGCSHIAAAVLTARRRESPSLQPESRGFLFRSVGKRYKDKKPRSCFQKGFGHSASDDAVSVNLRKKIRSFGMALKCWDTRPWCSRGDSAGEGRTSSRRPRGHGSFPPPLLGSSFPQKNQITARLSTAACWLSSERLKEGIKKEGC